MGDPVSGLIKAKDAHESIVIQIRGKIAAPLQLKNFKLEIENTAKKFGLMVKEFKATP
jgi:hypothetical protein